MEQVRLMMKTHAFVRSNITTSLAFGNEHKKDQSINKSAGNEEGFCPDFSKYLYFTFAPTLVYKNEYPRSLFKVTILTYRLEAELLIIIYLFVI